MEPHGSKRPHNYQDNKSAVKKQRLEVSGFPNKRKLQ